MPSFDAVYILSVFAAAALMLGLAAYAWRHRDLPAIPAFFVLILAVAEWTFAVGAMTVAAPDGWAPFWHRAISLGICAVPLAALVFFVQFTGRAAWLPPRRILVLALPLAVLQVLFWTNDLHHLLFERVEFTRIGRLTLRRETYGPLYWVHSIYGHLMIGVGIVYLMLAAFRAVAPFRQQILVLLLAAAIPLVMSVSETLQLTHVIIVPFGFAAMGLIMGWSIFRLQFLDLLPVARSKLVDTLPDPMIAVDNLDRIIDANPATLELIAEAGGGVPGRIIGLTMDEVLGPWRQEFREFRDRSHVKAEIRFKLAGRRRYFDLRITPIFETLHQPRGRLIVLREITEMKEAQRELRRLATTDTLTGALNRRLFFDLANREVERSHRFDLPLALILLDLDHFKQVNDTHGHPVGDRVLQAFSELCRASIREIDLFARYGGEEFALVLPETRLDQAKEAAERLAVRLRAMSVPHEAGRIRITASMGIAVYAGAADTLGGMLQRADRALYAAKAAGRNRVEAWVEPQPTAS